MTCGIWKRSLPPSGFIILPQPGKPWGCPRLRGPLAPSPAAAGEQGEGTRWLRGHAGDFGSYRDMLSGRLGLQSRFRWVRGARFGFCLPAPARCSLSVPFRAGAASCGAFALHSCRRETLPFPVSLVQFLGWVGWLGSALPCRCSPPPRQNQEEKEEGTWKAQLLSSFPTKHEVPGCPMLSAPQPLGRPSSSQKTECSSTGGLCPVSWRLPTPGSTLG